MEKQEQQTAQSEAHQHVIAALLNGARKLREQAEMLERQVELEQGRLARKETEGEAKPSVAVLERLLAAVGDDGLAATYQTLGQYRTAMMNSIRRFIQEERARV